MIITQYVITYGFSFLMEGETELARLTESRKSPAFFKDRKQAEIALDTYLKTPNVRERKDFSIDPMELTI